MILSTWPSRGNEKVIAESKRVLQEAGIVDLMFHGGFSGEPVSRSVALLYLLGEPDILPFLVSLTEKKGAPAIYGLIGIRHVNPKSEEYKKCLRRVLERDGENSVETAMADVIAEEKVKDLLLLPGDAENKKKLMLGDYYSEVFSETPLKQLDFVVDNGLLGEHILNPFMFFNIDASKLPQLADYELQTAKNAKKVVAWKLLHRNPREVLRLAGFENDEHLLYSLRDR